MAESHRPSGKQTWRVRTFSALYRQIFHTEVFPVTTLLLRHLAPSSAHMGTENPKKKQKSTPCTLWYDGCPPISGDACDKDRHSVTYILHTTHIQFPHFSTQSRAATSANNNNNENSVEARSVFSLEVCAEISAHQQSYSLAVEVAVQSSRVFKGNGVCGRISNESN